MLSHFWLSLPLSHCILGFQVGPLVLHVQGFPENNNNNKKPIKIYLNVDWTLLHVRLVFLSSGFNMNLVVLTVCHKNQLDHLDFYLSVWEREEVAIRCSWDHLNVWDRF